MITSEAPAPMPRVSVRPAVDAQERIEALIRDEGLRSGHRLPPERELAERWGISRSAVRAAIRSLVAACRLVQRQGSGTFVAKQRVTRNLRDLKSFADAAHENGRAVETEVLSCEQENADMPSADSLNIDLADPVWRLWRLRILDGTPAVLEESRLPMARFPELADRIRHVSSLYTMLDEVYGAEVDSGHEVLAVGLADATTAQLLDIEPGDTVFELSGVACDRKGTAFEVFKSWVRSDQVSFASELHVPSN